MHVSIEYLRGCALLSDKCGWSNFTHVSLVYAIPCLNKASPDIYLLWAHGTIDPYCTVEFI